MVQLEIAIQTSNQQLQQQTFLFLEAAHLLLTFGTCSV